MRQAMLALEDGTVCTGQHFGALGQTQGEIVFNTSMTGYQEILTDPSYRGEIVVMTYPLIGNYGHIAEDMESSKVQVKGMVVKELCCAPSNWRSTQTLKEFLVRQNTVCISGLDTRALTQKIRQKGSMRGIITSEICDIETLVAQAKTVPDLSDRDLVKEVTTDRPYVVGAGNKYRVALLDCGSKRSIIKSLVACDCEVIVLPATTSAVEILALEVHGVLLSNGPGDPQSVPYLVETTRALLGRLPIFGICLGHQILALACGGRTYKMKFGHRGGNHPVKDLLTGRVHITSQNHGFAIDKTSLHNLDVEITHVNVNDGTVEGLRHKYLSAYSVQYHPESAPGPCDSEHLFIDFLTQLES